MNKGNFLRRKEQDTEEHWISISDMMAGLMVVFLFIAISYMLNVLAPVEAHIDLLNHLCEELNTEFEDDFQLWEAELDCDALSIRFNKTDVLFPQASIKVSDHFKKTLNEFFPRYIEILTKPKYKDHIAEIRIEGHTSSEWSPNITPDEAYILNMELSQGRTRSVLTYVLQIRKPSIKSNKAWIKAHLTANGLSSSKPILNPDGTENRPASRRVEFRVRTNVENLIKEIIESGERE